ncbi:uncharacterized protein FIBRA_08225 [Fibroporia radiculosa]|uniref:Uncharacterized protein n=1 Tax=Fibroporia radiculosa TaxID=599839 RepID=J4H522_9APHY|nr:uncharacterized protein FIBRA_08225 [Fibroporia radiculosa]CCM05984.1 predicted protein [Fibroporia radiculosa]
MGSSRRIGRTDGQAERKGLGLIRMWFYEDLTSEVRTIRATWLFLDNAWRVLSSQADARPAKPEFCCEGHIAQSFFFFLFLLLLLLPLPPYIYPPSARHVPSSYLLTHAQSSSPRRPAPLRLTKLAPGQPLLVVRLIFPLIPSPSPSPRRTTMYRTYCPCPRPILKRPATESDLPTTSVARDEPAELLAIDRGVLQPVVRFPSKPTLSKTFSVDSAAQYDRSPIVVQPNRCALPARGCPGRTYAVDDELHSRMPPSPSPSARSGRHQHPRASPSYPHQRDDDDAEDDDLTPRATPVATMPVLPPLIPDLSSESDESDGFASPAPDYAVPAAAYGRTGLAMSRTKAHGADSLGLSFSAMQLTNSPSALAFLPHPPSPRMRTSPSAPGHPPEQLDERARTRHRLSSAARSSSPSSTSPNRQNCCSSPTRRRHRPRASASPDALRGRYKALSEKSALSGCTLAVLDQGCLGGF